MKTEARTDRKAFVTLRFAGDDLDPREISAILPVAPTRAHRKGEEFIAGQNAGKLRGRTGIWFLSTDKLMSSDDLEDHFAFVQRLLYRKASDDSRIAKLRDVLAQTHSRARITCFWRGEPGEDAPQIPARFMSAIEPLSPAVETDFSISPRNRRKRTPKEAFAKIHRFEIGLARRGGVYCPPLDLNFPTLFRVVQNVSREQLDEAGLTDEEPLESYVHYTIGENQRFLGSTKRAVARGVIDATAPSLVIRWQPNEELAASYLDALADISDPEDWNGELCRTHDGLFTLAERTTHRDWPGPLVIYLAEYPTGRPYPFETEIWYVAFRPDGSIHHLPDYEVPDGPNSSELGSGAGATKVSPAKINPDH